LANRITPVRSSMSTSSRESVLGRKISTERHVSAMGVLFAAPYRSRSGRSWRGEPSVSAGFALPEEIGRSSSHSVTPVLPERGIGSARFVSSRSVATPLNSRLLRRQRNLHPARYVYPGLSAGRGSGTLRFQSLLRFQPLRGHLVPTSTISDRSW
jgi:hypothetical protein